MRDRAGRLASPLGVGALVGLATFALHVRDPHDPGSWGVCPTKLLTAWDCPLCGGLRAVNDLTHVDLASALSSNLLVVVAVPAVLALWVRRLVACWRGGEALRPLPVPAGVWVGLLVVTSVFTVVRNLPGSWLAA